MPDVGDDRVGDDAELAELRAFRSQIGSTPVDWEVPPDDLWARIAAATDQPGAAPRAAEPPAAEVVPITRPLRARRYRLLASAAAVVVVIGAVVGFIALTGTDGADVVAATALERLGQRGSGSVELLDDDGRLELHVETADLDPGDGFLEVWMIDPTVTRLVSLGPLRPDGVYDLPPGLDPGEFPVVDVSIEPIDGNPTHSGDSVLRGQLPL